MLVAKRNKPDWKWKLNTHVFATTPNRPVSLRRRDHDGKVVSTSMRNIQQMMMSRPVEVAVAPRTSLS